MHIAITGATGFVGQQLVPILIEKGHSLTLIGRELDLLKERFGHFSVQLETYDQLKKAFADVETLIHLATLNNNKQADHAEFERVNVDLFEQILTSAEAAGVKRVIYASSFHVLKATSSYAVTKKRAEALLGDHKSLIGIIIRFPAIVGPSFKGIDRLPRFLSAPVLQLLTSLKPTIGLDQAVAVLESHLQGEHSTMRMISDCQQGNVIYQASKRLIDLAFVACVVILFGWLIALLALLIRLDSPGPAIFSQQRVGKDGKIFVCHKLRTMFSGTAEKATRQISKISVTRIGAFLRQTKLDELPQIWNIARKEMSLIGPRPCLPTQIELIEERQKRGVDQVLPGLTGLAQIRHIDMSDPGKLAKTDSEYIARRSLFMDLHVVLRTFLSSHDNVKS